MQHRTMTLGMALTIAEGTLRAQLADGRSTLLLFRR